MNDVIEKPEAPKRTFQEKAIAHFQEAIIEACRELPELRQVAVIFDWAGGLNQGATPFLIGDQDGPLGTTELNNIHGMLEQHAKAITYLSQLLLQSLERHGELCTQMETRFREAQEQEGAQEGTQREGTEQVEEGEAGEQDATDAALGDGSRFD